MSAAVAVFGIALLAALLYAVLEKQAPAYALLLSLGAALVLLVRAGTSIRTVLSGIARLAGQADSGAFSCLVRSAAIVLLTDYTRTLCEEAGAESLGWCVGLAGRCLVLAAAWPLLEEILQTIGALQDEELEVVGFSAGGDELLSVRPDSFCSRECWFAHTAAGEQNSGSLILTKALWMLCQVAEDPWSVLQSFCTSSLFQTLRESIRGYAALLLFLLLSAIVSLFLGEEGDHSWCDLVCAGGCGILLWEPLLEIARQLCAQIESWNRFLSGFLPVYAGVLIMGGETSAGAAASGFFLTLLCLLAQALTAFVPPILECFLALSMACCITEQSCLGNLCKAAGILLQKGLSLTGKLLAALLGFQRISAAQLDRTALRTGQFLTGTIPIVGQSLSDASEAVLAGIQLLKSGLGMAAILILLAEFLPLYLGMLAHLGCIVLCGTLCSLTGNNRGQALLTCFTSAVRCMMACLALFFGLAVTGTALLFMLGGV